MKGLLKGLLIVSAICFLISVSLWAVERSPLYIKSDRMEVYQKQNLVVFLGHVKATQKDITITADAIKVFYQREPKDDSQKNSNNNSRKVRSKIVKIEAEGHVIVSQGNRIARGDKAVFLKDTQQIILTGHPQLQEQNNLVKGDQIIIYLNQNKMIVNGEKQPVTAVFYPQNENK